MFDSPTTQLLDFGEVKIEGAVFDPQHQGIDLLVVDSRPPEKCDP